MKECTSCGRSSFYHLESWLDEIFGILIPNVRLPQKVDFALANFVGNSIEKILLILGLGHFTSDYGKKDIQLRSWLLTQELKNNHNINCEVFRSAFGYTGNFRAHFGLRTARFETLPVKFKNFSIDNKETAKKILEKAGLPVASGHVFWFWQVKKAAQYGNKLGFPLVVKPRGGSVSSHVTTNIQNESELRKAISFVLKYSPVFIVERHVGDSFVFRSTVVGVHIFSVKPIPANFVEDGPSTIAKLITHKNSDPKRIPELYHAIVTDNKFLKNQKYSTTSVPPKGEIVYLQRDPFVKLGGDLEEVTPLVHPDNLKLFRKTAELFGVNFVGIDFIARDIKTSWRDQVCAILELNSIPCIEMHHFPVSGTPVNVAGVLADIFLN